MLCVGVPPKTDSQIEVETSTLLLMGYLRLTIVQTGRKQSDQTITKQRLITIARTTVRWHRLEKLIKLSPVNKQLVRTNRVRKG